VPVGWEKELLKRYFDNDGFAIVYPHSQMVAELATKISKKLKLSPLECAFIREASLLHDIGICQVYAPGIGMYGSNPYIMHGVLGRQILEKEALPQHALVCERHTGVGLTIDDIVRQNLPLPHRDMTPQTVSEEIICFADLFYSKTPGKLEKIKSPDKVRKKLSIFGEDKLQIFDRWMEKYGKFL